MHVDPYGSVQRFESLYLLLRAAKRQWLDQLGPRMRKRGPADPRAKGT